jgi:hypothetical protein
MEEVAVWWWGDAKKVIEPSRLQIQTSAAPASKYKAHFTLISYRETWRSMRDGQLTS